MYYIEVSDVKVVGYCISFSGLEYPFIEVEQDIINKINECPRDCFCRYINGKIEYIPIEGYQELIDEHEQIAKETHANVETTGFDNLINMDMLISMDEKINAVMRHLGLTL